MEELVVAPGADEDGPPAAGGLAARREEGEQGGAAVSEERVVCEGREGPPSSPAALIAELDPVGQVAPLSAARLKENEKVHGRGLGRSPHSRRLRQVARLRRGLEGGAVEAKERTSDRVGACRKSQTRFGEG